MFTGFATENTPAIKVWNFFRSYTGTAIISLSDDCAPIQLIKTGGNSSDILLYLPSAPIEGQRITIQNSMYGTFAQKVKLFSSDISGSGSNTLVFTIGSACSLDLIYSKDFISSGVSSGTVVQTGWVALNFSPRSSYSYGSTVIASDNSNAYEYGSVILGGSTNIVGAREAVVLGGNNNTISGLRSSVIGGSFNLASGSESGVFGGSSNTAGAQYAATIGGNNISASSRLAIALGGQQNSANATSSTCIGGGFGTVRSIVGNVIFTACETPTSFVTGGQQTGLLIIGRETTNATATRLTSNTNAAGTTNQVILPNNSAYTFQGTCIAAKTAAGDTSSWKFEGAIKRGANAASTVLVAAVTPTVIAQDAGASTWVLAITADTTNGGIAVTVTGQAATTIRWVVKIETTEVTF